MIEKTAAVQNDLGLHARPAARLVSIARDFNAEIKLRANNREADAKSVAALLMLAAAQNTQVQITATGPDEAEAASAVADFFAAGCHDSAE